MNVLSDRFLPVMRLAVFAALGFAGNLANLAAATNPPPARIDYAAPPLATATIYASGADEKKVLFTCRRTAARSNATVRVQCDYTRPDGALAARERFVYEADRLVSYEREDLQAKLRGGIVIRPARNDPQNENICFESVRGGGARKQVATELLVRNTLVNDMVYPFILAHWQALMDGTVVRFRFVSLERAATYAFKLTRDSATTWHGRPAIRLKMEASNLIVAHFINPLYFYLEPDGPHRILKYTGRVTPRIRIGTAWKQTDAETVIDWKSPEPAGAKNQP